MNNNTILIVVAVVVVLGAILFFAFGNNDAMNTPNALNNNASTSQEVADYNALQNMQAGNDQEQDQNNAGNAANSVTLADTPSGNFAIAAQATLTKPGYVVFYRINSNGDSEILGNTDLLDAGSHSNLRVQLSEPVADRQAVVAVLHEDDGDGEFEYPESDGYLVNAGGMLVSDIDVVEVSSSAAENKVLEAQVAAYLENNFQTGTSTN